MSATSLATSTITSAPSSAPSSASSSALLVFCSDSDDDDATCQVFSPPTRMVCTLDQARIHMIQARAQLSPAADSTQAALVNQAVRVDRIRRAESAVHQLTSVLEPAVDESSDDEDDALKQLSVMMGITPNPQGVSQTSHCPSSSSSSSLDSNSDEADDILSTWIEKTTFWRGYGVASLAQWISKRNASDTSARDFDTLD